MISIFRYSAGESLHASYGMQEYSNGHAEHVLQCLRDDLNSCRYYIVLGTGLFLVYNTGIARDEHASDNISVLAMGWHASKSKLSSAHIVNNPA